MILDRRFYAAGQRIFSEGDDASCVYLVQRGIVRIFKGEGEEEVTLALIGPNGLFGEMAIVDDGPRSANAAAAEDATLIRVPKYAMQERINGSDALVRLLVRVLTRNLRATTDQVTRLARELKDGDEGDAGVGKAAKEDRFLRRRTDDARDLEEMEADQG